MRKLLWLTSWYPNERDPFAGDFIRRMAEAVSVYQAVDLLFVGKAATQNSAPLNKAEERSSGSNLHESIYYYQSGNKNNPLSKIASIYAYLKQHYRAIEELKRRNELPDLVHVHVAMRSGIVALYLRWKYKIPFVITEHWSGYYEQSGDSLFHKSLLTKYLTRRVLKTASMLLPVSDSLGKQINFYWAQVPFKKISNVVNTSFFYPVLLKPTGRFRFIHVSSLLYPKNPAGIINAFSKFIKSGADAELILAGPLNDTVTEHIKTSGAGSLIHCTGEISYERVGQAMRDSSAFILFSEYENMPCVLLEALCSGLPVIATAVGGIPEVINSCNGILVNAGNETELLEAMRHLMIHYAEYDRDQIAKKAATEFSYKNIAEQIIAVYDSVLEISDDRDK